MRKRLTALLLALIWVAALSACGAAPRSEAIVQLPVAGPGTEVSQEPSVPPETSQIESPSEKASEEVSLPAEPPPEETPLESGTPTEFPALSEDGWYNSKDDVALYIYLYGRLPGNYVTKQDAQAKGWTGGSVEPYTGEGTALGGSRFGNYEGLLPEAKGRTYTECDIDTVGRSSRGPKRVVFSNDGLVYYTGDHYESFELLYGEAEE